MLDAVRIACSVFTFTFIETFSIAYIIQFCTMNLIKSYLCFNIRSEL